MNRKIRNQLVSFLLLTCMIFSLTGCEPLDSDVGDTSSGDENHTQANYSVDLDASKLTADSKISDILYGIFFEDINYSVDAGVYAGMIKNRSFEYGSKASNSNKHGWTTTDASLVDFQVVDGSKDGTALNEANPHYAVIHNKNTGDYGGSRCYGYLKAIGAKV